MKSFPYFLALILSVIVLTGCCHNQVISYPSSQVSTMIESTVALVELREGKNHPFCTGIWLSPNIILTAAHCTRDGEEDPIGTVIKFSTKEEMEDNKSHFAVVTNVDSRRDLAIIKSIDFFLHPQVVIAEQDAPVGEHIEIVGHTVGLSFSYIEGVLSAYRIDDDAVQVLQISSAAFMGNSGGPAFDSHGHLVGVCSFIRLGVPNVTFFISRESILNFLHDEKITI